MMSRGASLGDDVGVWRELGLRVGPSFRIPWCFFLNVDVSVVLLGGLEKRGGRERGRQILPSFRGHSLLKKCI